MLTQDIFPAAVEKLTGPAARLARMKSAPLDAALLAARAAPPADLRGITGRDVLREPVTHAEDAECVLCGLLLLFDDLDSAHRICQSIETSTASFWHAIVHRREGDFSNSKYWYARAAGHPAAGPTVHDGSALVDLVRDVHSHPDDARFAQAIVLQRIEWQRLMAHSILAGVGQ